MAKGKKTGGRIKGEPNKDKKELIEMIQDKYPGWHPLMALAELAQDEDKNIKLQASKEVCKYVAPQLKSIDHSIDTTHDITVTIGGNKV